MSPDPLDIIDAASQQFVVEIAALPKRVDSLESEIRTIKRVLACASAVLFFVAAEVARNLIRQNLG